MLDINNIVIPDSLDYDGLRKYGLEYIRAMGGKIWTDFNAHDPGITILEAISFALADLSYRTSFPVGDLLTPAGSNTPALEGSLFPAQEIFKFNPYTKEDYRKLILENVPGVRNVHFETTTKDIQIHFSPYVDDWKKGAVEGYYKIIVELEGSEAIKSNKTRAVVGRNIRGKYDPNYLRNPIPNISHYIKNLLFKNRNLCENFADVTFVTPIEVGICLSLETDQVSDYKVLLQTIYDKVYDYVCPTIQFHTVEELLARGRTPEQIFQGGNHKLGFLDIEELKDFKQVRTLYISDIKNILMKIDGIKSILALHFIVSDKDKKYVDIYDHKIELIDDNHSFNFCPRILHHSNVSTLELKNQIRFFRSNIPFLPGKADTDIVLKDSERKPLPNGFSKEMPVPEGKYRDRSNYYSFQNLFPRNYKMGLEKIADSETSLRKAQRLQLKAYLSFFDRLLADYLAQLEHFSEWLSIDYVGKEKYDSYFHKVLVDGDIVDISKVLEPGAEQVPIKESVIYDRQNRLMDHLLARFNDSFVDYAALKFLCLGDNYDSAFDVMDEKESVEDKKRLLRVYPQSSGNRAQAIDFTENIYISGVERRILHKLGINDTSQRVSLAPRVINTLKNGQVVFADNRKDRYDKTFGIHIIEHLLLVPEKNEKGAFLELFDEDEKKSVFIDNPYSFRVTVLAPGWLDISHNMYFRQFVERTIREELPAHIASKICWVDPLVMKEAEDAYDNLLAVYADYEHPNPSKEWISRQFEAVKGMLRVFDTFANIYPTIQLSEEESLNAKDMRLDFAKIDDSGQENNSRWTFAEKKL